MASKKKKNSTAGLFFTFFLKAIVIILGLVILAMSVYLVKQIILQKNSEADSISDEAVFEDTTPDFVFHGTLASSGNVETDGSGRVVLTDFYRLDDHQYAFGSMYWPDGATSYLMLVRP